MNTAYRYWLVRYVPDVVRGECVNVAVIAGVDGGDWAVRVTPNLQRASRLGGDAGALRPWLERLERSISNYEAPPLEFFTAGDDVRVSQAWLELVSHRFNNVVQLNSAAPVEAKSASDAVDFLFPVLVAPPQAAVRSRTRTRMVSDLLGLFEHTAGLEAGASLLRQPRASVGRQRGRFDFAVVDSQVGQLSQAFAFDVRNADALEQELQSWNFVVSRLREDGANVTSDGREFLAPPSVPIAVAFQEPIPSASNRHHDVFAAAREAWGSLQIHAVPSTELDVIAHDARELIAA